MTKQYSVISSDPTMPSRDFFCAFRAAAYAARCGGRVVYL